MKLAECKECTLCKSRVRTSPTKGKSPSNVLIVFGKEPNTKRAREQQQLFIKKLNEHLCWDWCYTYAIKCYTKKPAKPEHIKACRIWLNEVFKKSKPYLIVLMGKLAVKSMLGEKYVDIPAGIFYMKKSKKGSKHQYYIGPRIGDIPSVVEEHLNKLLIYIKENYG